MVTAGDFRNGLTFEMDGNEMQVIEQEIETNNHGGLIL